MQIAAFLRYKREKIIKLSVFVAFGKHEYVIKIITGNLCGIEELRKSRKLRIIFF